MRGVRRCPGATGRMKKHRDRNEFNVTSVKMANAADIETKAVGGALSGIRRNMPARLCREGVVAKPPP